MEKVELFTQDAWPLILAIGFLLGCLFFVVLISWINHLDYRRAKRRAERRLRKVERRQAKFNEARQLENIKVNEPQLVK